MADEVASVVMVGKSTPSTKRKLPFNSEEGKNNIVWSEEKVLFNTRHKDYYKSDVRQNAIKAQLLHQLPVNPSLCSPPKPFPFPHFVHLSLLCLSSLTNYSSNDCGRNLPNIGQFVCCYPQSSRVEMHAILAQVWSYVMS